MSGYRRARGMGEWNAECAYCGFEMSSAKLRQNWKGLRVCSECWERKPETFDLRVKKDRQTVPFVQKNPDRAIDPLSNYGGNGVDAILNPKARED